MDLQSMIKKVKRGQEEKEVLETSNWSELNPDLLQCVFDRLSFTSLNQAKLVCSSWYSASKVCVPNQNQIPWLFLKDYNRSSCMVFVPEEKVYRIRHLDVDFGQSHCVMTCGSWLLLRRLKKVVYLYYILNLLTGERIDLPDSLNEDVGGFYHEHCFWIDNISKDYFVVVSGNFTKKGYNNWRKFLFTGCEHVFYKNQKIYINVYRGLNVYHGLGDIWDFSREMPRLEGYLSLPYFTINHNDFPDEHCGDYFQTRMTLTASGDFLMVSYIAHHGKPLYFCIYKTNKANDKWLKIDSLGDEALIYDMGITVIANGNIPGIKRNSIYFSNRYDVFVYDLATQKKEPLPECVLSSMSFNTRAPCYLILFRHCYRNNSYVLVSFSSSLNVLTAFNIKLYVLAL